MSRQGRIVETTDLRRTFDSRRGPVEAVAGVTLEVDRGEIFGFLGPNGAGKTTTLRMLTTVLPPSGGKAIVAGFDLVHEANRVREHVGYVSQQGGTDPTLSARDELVFQGRLYRMPAAEAERRAQEVLSMLDLTECADRATETYSGGQRRRLAVGLGLMHRPHLLFLDEPTTGLDPQSRAHLWEEVRRLRDGGTTIFLTTHYLDEADALCDRIAIIDHGTIVAEGTPDSLKAEIAGDLVTIGIRDRGEAALMLLRGKPFVREIPDSAPVSGQIRLYVDRGETAMPAILRLLDGIGLELETISLARPSLDDVFLRKTGRSLREVAA
jgi:ABC-2 type transport system ATP-binding protein